VLIVDDSALNTQLAEHVLTAAGYVVASALDPFQARARIIEFRPDLILMDVQMPGMNGLELTRRLKADGATRDIPIVAVTAFAQPGDETRLLAVGCSGLLTKPIDVKTFAAAVGNYLLSR